MNKFFKNNIIRICILISLLLLAGLIAISSIVNIYDNRNLFSKLFKATQDPDYSYGLTKEDKYWANKILDGGYILHFRHAERDKWIDVQMYDSLESDVHNNGINESRYAENTYFEKAVCLNERGKVQAKSIAEHLANINFPFGYVVSSPSCRARQTANLAFGGYDSLDRILVHSGPYNENYENRIKLLKSFYRNLPLTQNENTIVSAHNSVIECGMFVNKCSSKLSIEEGGFYVISSKSDGLYLEHEFHYFKTFIQNFFDR